MVTTPDTPCINCGKTDFSQGYPVMLKGSDWDCGTATEGEPRIGIPATPLDIPCLVFICGNCGTIRLIQPPAAETG